MNLYGNQYVDWTIWSSTPPGSYILAWEQKQLDSLVSDMFGYHAVQIGLPHLSALRENRMSHRTLLLNEAFNETKSPNINVLLDINEKRSTSVDSIVVSEFLDLPFATKSIDLLILPHALESTKDPHALLREAERILVSEGRLVIVGFNSLSLWGVYQSIMRMTNRSFLPDIQNLIAFTRVKDWIKLLGFEFNLGCFGCYRPPIKNEKWLGRCAFMEKSGNRWWPLFGAIFLIAAIKRENGMRLIGPTWKKYGLTALPLSPDTVTFPESRDGN